MKIHIEISLDPNKDFWGCDAHIERCIKRELHKYNECEEIPTISIDHKAKNICFVVFENKNKYTKHYKL